MKFNKKTVFEKLMSIPVGIINIFIAIISKVFTGVLGFFATIISMVIVVLILVKCSNGTKFTKIENQSLEFNLSTDDNKTLTSQDLLGHNYALMFTSPLCGPCKNQLPLMAQLRTKIKTIGVLSGQHKNQLRYAYQEYAKAFDYILIDDYDTLFNSLNVRAFPTTVIVGTDGKIQKYIKGQMRRTDINNIEDVALKTI
jgi:thioredoxin-related protein